MGNGLTARNGRATSVLALALALGAMTGCSRATPAGLSDAEQIVRAVLDFESADGRSVCVDRRTVSAPLINFRTMSEAPAPSRAILGWSVPRPLRSVNDLTARRMFDDQILGRRVVLAEPKRTPRLSADVQRDLNAIATRLSLTVDDETVRIRDGWGGAATIARWWPLNRIAPSCSPLYRFTNPVFYGTTGFQTVLSDHWGTTYALKKRGGRWVPVAQWTPWLY